MGALIQTPKIMRTIYCHNLFIGIRIHEKHITSISRTRDTVNCFESVDLFRYLINGKLYISYI